MKINKTEIVDTFAEAFKMWGSRIIITADSLGWARAAAQSMTGFATSVIRCKCEAAVECEIAREDTPDGRPGISVLLFTMDKDNMSARLVDRIGQCVMTCPTTACYNGLNSDDTVPVGGRLRYFGDGYQISKKIGDRKLWRIPVMEGEFVVDDSFASTGCRWRQSTNIWHEPSNNFARFISCCRSNERNIWSISSFSARRC